MKNEEMLKALTDMGLSMTNKFVPWPQSRNAKEPPCLNWKVNIFYKGQPILPNCDFTAGAGYCPSYTQGPLTVDMDAAIRKECVTGMSTVNKYRMQRVIDPNFAQVLHSLLMDATAIDNTFEEWCKEFGYSDDSMKAKRMYDDCIRIAIGLRKIGEENLTKLRTLFQDY